MKNSVPSKGAREEAVCLPAQLATSREHDPSRGDLVDSRNSPGDRGSDRTRSLLCSAARPGPRPLRFTGVYGVSRVPALSVVVSATVGPGEQTATGETELPGVPGESNAFSVLEGSMSAAHVGATVVEFGVPLWAFRLGWLEDVPADGVGVGFGEPDVAVRSDGDAFQLPVAVADRDLGGLAGEGGPSETVGAEVGEP
jgi:hypothetical protein